MDEVSSFAVILLLASISALILRRFKVAPVAAYILAGLIVGPVLGIVDPSSRPVEFLSEIGIALISFQIGLSVKSDLIRHHGPRILFISFLELIIAVFLSSVFGIVAGLPMGVTFVLIMIAVNSSTIIAFKLLESKGMTGDPLFTVIVGVGTIEDVVVMTGISLIPALATLGRLMIGEGFSVVGNMIGIVLVMLVFGLRLLPKVLRFIMKYGDMETLLLIILAVAIGYGMIGGYMGLSFALGSFLAGVIISTIEMPPVAMDRLTSLRDLFVIIFFISIGMSMPPIESPFVLFIGVGLAAMIIMIKVISITFASWIAIGIGEAFRIGIYMMSISELALIVAREAYKVGLVDQNIFISSAFVVLISVSLSSKLSEIEVLIVRRAASMVPTVIQVFMERLSSTTRIILEKLMVSKDCQPILLSLSKKLLSMVAVLTLGSIIIQNTLIAEELANFGFIVETGIIASLLAFSIIMTLMSRRDLERLIVWYTQSFSSRRSVASVIKNSFYMLLFLILSIMVLLNITSIARRVLAGYFEAGIASIVVFAIIVSFIMFSIYLLYGKMRKDLDLWGRA